MNPDDFARAVTGRDDLGAWSDCLEEAGRLGEARVLRAALRAGREPHRLLVESHSVLAVPFPVGSVCWGWYPPHYGSGRSRAILPDPSFTLLAGYYTPQHYVGRYYATCGLAWAAYLAARLAVRRGRAGVGKGVGR